MLNFGPKANGEIPDEVKTGLLDIGNWMNINKEAIYNTTPWGIAEEGPTELLNAGGFSEENEVSYTSSDLRFVTKDNSLYIFSLGWPKKQLLIKSLIKPPVSRSKWNSEEEFYMVEEPDIKSIRILGSNEDLIWNLTDQGLRIIMPQEKPCNHAVAFKISWS
jgi:alpha-L-fucosidase